ncbi:unnamed protein product [Nyctereutes procyonoides]|uniref:(raccoon dog) hypothetical protein n=1 Tax=Nyctereutes procyonoides TaxID=34880 RepID=A0A811YCV5_NYCPR|nr:unnamed protein product [Nyctereutes procyonoides]
MNRTGASLRKEVILPVDSSFTLCLGSLLFPLYMEGRIQLPSLKEAVKLSGEDLVCSPHPVTSEEGMAEEPQLLKPSQPRYWICEGDFEKTPAPATF